MTRHESEARDAQARVEIGDALALLRVAQADPSGEVRSLRLAARCVTEALQWAVAPRDARKGVA